MKQSIGMSIILIILVAVTYVLGGFLPTRDTTDSGDERSGMILHTDNLTGCQYLSKIFGGITPRLDIDGEQICINPTRNKYE